MKKNLFCLLFLLLNHTLNAQFTDLIKDKNISWIGASSIDVRLDMLHDKALYDAMEKTKYVLEGLDILKLETGNNGEMEEGFSAFAHILLEAAKNKQIVAYSDSLCLYPIDVINVITRLDTVYHCFAQTYENPGYSILRNVLNAEDIKVFRAHQITTYSPKNGTWHSKTISVAPLKIIQNEAGEFISLKPIFWMKVDNKKANLNTSDITWAVRTRPRGREGLLDFTSVKIHKKTDANMPMLHFLDLAKNDKNMRLYRVDIWRQKKILPINGLQTIFSSTDTITDIDIITNKVKIRLVENKLDINDINELRFVQEWAWDNKRKALSVRLLGIAPMKKFKNEEGEFLFMIPLFYQRFDD